MNIINKIIEENHIKNEVNNEINYDELKEISIKIFNDNSTILNIYEKEFNIKIKKRLFIECDYKFKIEILFHCPDFNLILLNDFINFTYENVQKTKQNICSIVYNSCFIDGYKISRLPEYKYHSYLTYNKDTILLKWFNEYISLLKDFNEDIYIRLSNILLKLINNK